MQKSIIDSSFFSHLEGLAIYWCTYSGVIYTICCSEVSVLLQWLLYYFWFRRGSWGARLDCFRMFNIEWGARRSRNIHIESQLQMNFITLILHF